MLDFKPTKPAKLTTFCEATYIGTELAKIIGGSLTLIRRPNLKPLCWECIDSDGGLWTLPDNLLRPIQRNESRRRFLPNCRSAAEAATRCPWAKIIFSHDGGQWCIEDANLGELLANSVKA
jgi:hypothetical protein